MAIGLAWVLGAGGTARADRVYLENGQILEGKVRDGKTEETVVIESPSGVVIEVRRQEVVRIVPERAPEEELQERLARVPPGELAPLVELAVEARERRLWSSLREVSRRILTLDPNHPLARNALGYVVFENRWVLESALRKKKGLVKHRGEWMTVQERERRRLEEIRREVAELFHSVVSDNPYLQEFAVRKLLAYRGPAGLDLFAPYLEDERPEVRLVAASASFQVALEVLKGADGEAEKRRAADVLHRTLRKAWVPRLCRELTDPSGGRSRRPVYHAEVRAALKRALGVDFGYDQRAWLAWWQANEGRFRDVDPPPRTAGGAQ